MHEKQNQSFGPLIRNRKEQRAQAAKCSRAIRKKKNPLFKGLKRSK